MTPVTIIGNYSNVAMHLSFFEVSINEEEIIFLNKSAISVWLISLVAYHPNIFFYITRSRLYVIIELFDGDIFFIWWKRILIEFLFCFFNAVWSYTLEWSWCIFRDLRIFIQNNLDLLFQLSLNWQTVIFLLSKLNL